MAAPADLGGASPARAAVSNARADTNLLGLLGLELLLLVFFIMLAGAARPDAERALPVLQSLRQSFRQSIGTSGEPALSGGDSLGEPQLLIERTARTLRSALPLSAVSTWGDERYLYVDFPAGGFFSPEGARLLPLGRERLLRIAAVIGSATAGQRFAFALAVAPAMPRAGERLASAAAALAAAPPHEGPLIAFFDETAPADRMRFRLALGDSVAEGAP